MKFVLRGVSWTTSSRLFGDNESSASHECAMCFLDCCQGNKGEVGGACQHREAHQQSHFGRRQQGGADCRAHSRGIPGPIIKDLLRSEFLTGYLQVRLMNSKVDIGWFASCAILRMLFMPGSEQGEPSSVHVLNRLSKFACDIGRSGVAVNTLKPMNAVTSARATIVLGCLTFIVLSRRHLEFRLTRALASGLPTCSTLHPNPIVLRKMITVARRHRTAERCGFTSAQ